MRTRTIARLMLAVCLVPLVGCAAPSADVDLLEARLRDQQDLVAQYRAIVDSANRELELARGESQLLRTQLAEAGRQPLLPEQADQLLRAEQLTFHKLMTGTRDTDGAPGDDSLNIVLTPQSREGEAVKLIGALQLEAIDLSQDGTERVIGSWSYTPDEARDLWHNGFLVTGYQLELPWQQLPATPSWSCTRGC
ncbi:MAG: hypothetical protein R3B90_23190 [Planctomycetaceae bacterium]